jgi:hypothetical protein
VQIRDRITRLEAQAASTVSAGLTDRELRQLERWPEMLLERYVWGRLDDMAAMPSLPVRSLLEGLQRAGYAIEVDGHWHPLFLGADDETNAKVIERIEACEAANFNRLAPPRGCSGTMMQIHQGEGHDERSE